MFSEITQCLSEEVFNSQYQNRENVENICEYINLQITKEIKEEKEHN